jgi:preprotein translocase subunit SecB
MRKKYLNSNISRFLYDYASPIVTNAIYNGGFAPDEDPADYIRINARVIRVI